jgi:arginyl-tRNA synthetase
MIDELRWRLSTALKGISDSLYPGNDVPQMALYEAIETPPSVELGHLAFPSFVIAKKVRQNPMQVAQGICAALEHTSLLARVAVQGPYVNCFFKPAEIAEFIIEPILSGQSFKRTLDGAHTRLMIEYSQPNTHKELHVGHLRNLSLGNALVNILRYWGYDITAATYPGDIGTHVAKCLWYLKKYAATPKPDEDKGTWLGRMYSTAHNLLESERGTEKEESNRQELSHILRQLAEHKGEYYTLWQETREWSIDLMKHAYAWAEVSFDRWFFESEVDEPSLQYARELYQQGKLEESDGAIGMNLEDEKLGFCILIKSDGNGLYATKDVLLAKKKFDEFKIDKSIYLVDKRQAFHFQQVFKVLERLGFEKIKNCVHLEYDYVELPEGPMSSRKGNIIPFMDLVERMQAAICERYLSKYDDLSPEQMREIARIIANGAIKYGMLKYDNNKKIVFDMEEWLKIEGETGTYIQYAATRIRSIINKLGDATLSTPAWDKLATTQEMNLLLKLTKFNEVIHNCCNQYKATFLCTYLFELSRLFNAFYVECRIVDEADAGLKAARVKLVQGVYRTLEQGLALLGIRVPARM